MSRLLRLLIALILTLWRKTVPISADTQTKIDVAFADAAAAQSADAAHDSAKAALDAAVTAESTAHDAALSAHQTATASGIAALRALAADLNVPLPASAQKLAALKK